MKKQMVTRETIHEIHEAADNLGRFCGEISCVVLLLDHPFRNRKDIKDWAMQMRQLGYTERDGTVWP